jgi:hypothetical protein
VSLLLTFHKERKYNECPEKSGSSEYTRKVKYLKNTEKGKQIELK